MAHTTISPTASGVGVLSEMPMKEMITHRQSAYAETDLHERSPDDGSGDPAAIGAGRRTQGRCALLRPHVSKSLYRFATLSEDSRPKILPTLSC
jgi:hypothetical protein